MFERSVKHGGVLFLLAALVAVCAACDVRVDGNGGWSLDLAHGKAQDEWTRTYQLDPGEQLEIININGRIVAEAADGSTVDVRAERTARGSTDEAAKEVLDSIEMREEVGDARVRVEVRAPSRLGGRGH